MVEHNLDDMAAVGGEEMTLTMPSLPSGHQNRRAMTRSLSDGGSTPKMLSPSPFILPAARNLISKDDSALNTERPLATALQRPFDMVRRDLTLQIPAQNFATKTSSSASATPFGSLCINSYPSTPTTPTIIAPGSATALSSAVSSPVAPTFLQAPFLSTRATYVHTPTSPSFDHSQVFSAPNSVVSRRSRGLDFSRAATSLHHSMLADQPSPDSSPTIGRGTGIFNGVNTTAAQLYVSNQPSVAATDQVTSSLWSLMGSQERLHLATSQFAPYPTASDSSSSSEGGDFMDQDMEEAYVTMPRASASPVNTGAGVSVPLSLPVNSNLLSYQQRRRPRKQGKKRTPGPLGLGFSSNPINGYQRSPPHYTRNPLNGFSKELTGGGHSRRESISWQANRLQLSGSESEESSKYSGDTGDGVWGRPGLDGHRVIGKPVTRRGNLLPKPKNFARIRATLAEECAPLETELRREAEVLRNVRDSDMDLERQMAAVRPISTPNNTITSPILSLHEAPDGMIDLDMIHEPVSIPASLVKRGGLKHGKAHTFWDAFSEASSGAANRATPPPTLFPQRASSSGLSEDLSVNGSSSPAVATATVSRQPSVGGAAPPSAADISRRINHKRRCDDDLDPMSFKRRAVSPGVSVQGSPVLQNPMQRDLWESRPSSNGGGNGSGSGASASCEGHGISRLNGRDRLAFGIIVDGDNGMTE